MTQSMQTQNWLAQYKNFYVTVDGKFKQVKNLRWLLNHKDDVMSIYTLQDNTVIATLENGTKYYCKFADRSIMQQWVDSRFFDLVKHTNENYLNPHLLRLYPIHSDNELWSNPYVVFYSEEKPTYYNKYGKRDKIELTPDNIESVLNTHLTNRYNYLELYIMAGVKVDKPTRFYDGLTQILRWDNPAFNRSMARYSRHFTNYSMLQYALERGIYSFSENS